ncbi:MAG: ComEC/Rec2 family competence protein [Bacteroidales bacterium]|nr:ComEC/Rec2 family competence protein [Bacteroidales bacterium]
MKNKSGIVVLSFPFAAGVAAAALLNAPQTCAAASSATSAIFLLLCITSSKRCPGTLQALFLCLGAMCWSTSALLPPPARPAPSPAMDALCGMIDSAAFPGEHSGAIIKALLTGRRDALDAGTTAAFRRSGASHILALSGLHLGVIYLCLRRLLAPMGNYLPARILRSIVTVGLCGFYTLATGASPSIVRAFLFILIHEAGRYAPGRRHAPISTLCTALTIQLLLRPDLISSAGFQLSYLAMLGITLLFPRLEAWYPDTGRPDPMRKIWKAAALSLSCQAFTAPAAWFHFRSFPPYFLITNLIALPLTEIIIICAIATLVLVATGINPHALATACGTLVQALEFCLETIATL